MKTIDFLVENGFVLDGSNREKIAAAFDAEITAGLAGRPSTLRMLPANLSGDERPLTGVPAVVIDAGGTNLRVASVTLSEKGPQIRHLQKTFMPGTRGELTAEAFHSSVAAEADRVFAAEPAADRLGYCFSYECASLPDHDARLIAWSKAIAVPEAVGQCVGAELVRRLAHKPSSFAVLNDTVATLLAGRANAPDRRYSGYLGFILGTGTNIACVEDGMIRNAESGDFGAIDRSAFDVRFDATTADPGVAPFEKMIGGGFLGGLGLTILRSAAEKGLLGEGVMRLSDLSTRDLDDFAAGTADMANPLVAVLQEPERDCARELARAVFVRAANLTGIHLAAFLRRCPSSDDPVLITVDGSTFYKTRCVDFRAVAERELALLVPGRSYAFTRVDEAPMVGAAIAALMERH